MPEYTANVDALGVLRLLEAIRHLKIKKIKLYQASTSEIFGNTTVPQNEKQNLNSQARMLFRNYLLTGQLLIIEMRTIFLLLMESFQS